MTYSRQEIHHLLSMIQSGNPSLRRLPQCHGILGFVRFLHGYYMCLVTAIKKVAAIGGHLVRPFFLVLVVFAEREISPFNFAF